MRLLFDFSEVTPYSDILQSDEFPTIDTETMLDYIAASYVAGVDCKETVLAHCVDSISSVGEICESEDSFQKLINNIFNLITKVFEILSQYVIVRNISRNFVDTKTHRVWRDLYVIEFYT